MNTVSSLDAPPAARRTKLPRRLAMRLAATEYDRVAAAIASIPDDAWGRPTDCAAWDVRALACHVVGMAEMAADSQESARQRSLAAAKATAEGGEFVDALTDLQVSERADWSPAQIIEAVRSVGPRAARGRRATPLSERRGTIRARPLVNGIHEVWSEGYLVDTIWTRDPWMHRMDLARATGIAPTLTSEHDGQIVADVVEEWAERHGQPYQLELSGPAGGRWSARDLPGVPETISMDAIDFCRILSGRGTGQGLLATQLPF